jgi:hypothetical protein
MRKMFEEDVIWWARIESSGECGGGKRILGLGGWMETEQILDTG